ncbi:unnamed protein product [Rotaria socialis]|uniref:Uncharacterized protein n=1 Tax=Rotaria socialis TaxID=392032 RepID=A0A820Q2A8_9BILA|nr:unnamed protein product [Rotaria socialis]CAF3364607.1 unnamed protein product [Rotaria socialis]CAF4240124.1 unnamed protein product [Rotaria socialis]CAF4415331.1 unnamed protein product [Rotaria socialis]
MARLQTLFFLAAFSFTSGLDFKTKLLTKQGKFHFVDASSFNGKYENTDDDENNYFLKSSLAAISFTQSNMNLDCAICALDDIFNPQTNYTCFNMGLSGMTICTCPDGQYTVNTRCRLCDRPNLCGSGNNTYCSENPIGRPSGYTCFCPNNQFTYNKPCSDLPTTTQKTTTTTTTRPILTLHDSLGRVQGYIHLTENAQVAERDHMSSFYKGAAVRGSKPRSVGIYRVRFLIERMYLNRKLFIGVQSSTVSQCTYNMGYEDIYESTANCYYTPATGWFGNNSIAMHGRGYDSSTSAGPDYTGNYEQYYITNDIVTLIINCEEATLTLKNERTNKEYQMFINDHKSYYSRLPWIIYINLYYPGDKIRLLPLEDL